MDESTQQALEPSFSTLVISIGSTAIMSLGLTPNPSTGKTEKDLKMAKFNIDLLLLLKDKTKGNLSSEEEQFISNVINDVQIKYVNETKN